MGDWRPREGISLLLEEGGALVAAARGARGGGGGGGWHARERGGHGGLVAASSGQEQYSISPKKGKTEEEPVHYDKNRLTQSFQVLTAASLSDPGLGDAVRRGGAVEHAPRAQHLEQVAQVVLRRDRDEKHYIGENHGARVWVEVGRDLALLLQEFDEDFDRVFDLLLGVRGRGVGGLGMARRLESARQGQRRGPGPKPSRAWPRSCGSRRDA